MACPNCGSQTLLYAKKRGTYRCWTCSYEAMDGETHPDTEATLEDILGLLDPDSSYPRTLQGNERATIAHFINKIMNTVNAVDSGIMEVSGKQEHDDLSDPGGPGWPAVPVDHDVD